jgi:ssDNA-binding Zn-finger/Zn-ribbon topoisomerase 1
MKIICAWCQKLTGYKCPQCGDELQPAATPELRGRYMMCASKPTQIYFSIKTMETTHTICPNCQSKLDREHQRQTDRELSPEDRANLIAACTLSPQEARTSEDTDV